MLTIAIGSGMVDRWVFDASASDEACALASKMSDVFEPNLVAERIGPQH